MKTISLTLLLLAAAPVTAQDADPAPPGAELRAIFVRPAGTPISDNQKTALAAFVRRHDGRDLGVYGYARALHHYLQRDYDAALRAAEAFFAEYDAVPIEEHATMMGRIFLLGMMRAEDASARARYTERAVQHYPDAAMLQRALPRALAGLDADAARAVRLAVARGALAGARPEAERDALIAAAYAVGGEGAATTPALRLRSVPSAPGQDQARQRAIARREALTGEAAPPLAPLAVVGGGADLSLQGLRGKVVVLDFTATWCGPCRAVIPTMRALQAAHAGELQVVGVTRLYGHGSDFRDGQDGARATGLERADELALNRAFAEHFEIDYPIAVVEQATMRDGYGVTGIPTVFVLGRDGSVLGHAVGSGDASHEVIQQLVRRALAR